MTGSKDTLTASRILPVNFKTKCVYITKTDQTVGEYAHFYARTLRRMCIHYDDYL